MGFRHALLILLGNLGCFLTFASPLTLTITNVDISNEHCSEADGQIVITHTGTAPFSYDWSHDPNLNSATATGLSAGTYSLSITDDDNCEVEIDVTVSQVGLQLGGSTESDICDRGNGSATVNVLNGGTPPFTYQWDSDANNQTTQTATNLSSGTYDVTVTDSTGCTGSGTVFVPADDNNFGGNINVTDVDCYGASTGALSFVGTGGNGAWNVEWINASQDVVGTGLNISGLPTGPYQAIVTDPVSGGCEVKITVFVQEPDPLLADPFVNEATDCRSSDASAYVTPIGGSAPFTYLWSNGETTDTIRNLLPGVLTVTITDANGCSASNVVPITSAPGPHFTIDVLAEDKCGLGDGIARINISSGTAPYEVLWRAESTEPLDSGLYAYNLLRSEGDLFSAIVIDADSCVEVDFFMIPGNPPMEVVDQSSTPSYCELGDGTVTASFTGGTEPYQYQWTTSPPQFTQTAVGLIGGDYRVKVTDAEGCELETTQHVEKEIGFSLSVEATDESCYGTEDGTATVLVDGGKPPFNYEWNTTPVQNLPVIDQLASGAYNVHVTDAGGCERDAFGIVAAVDRVEADFSFYPDSQTIVLSKATFEFREAATGAESYRWDFGDGNFSTEANPVHIYRDTGMYFIELLVENNNGACADSIRYGPIHVIEDGNIYVPNAFTPNRDGFNDEFFVRGTGIEDFDLRIFARWGPEVFSALSPSERWNGDLPNGRPAPEGVYMYQLNAKVNGDVEILEHGTILLFR